MIELPTEEYIKKDGKTYCTMSQQVLHCIGLNDSCSYRDRPYTRHGRKFYKPWRNYFTSSRDDKTWCKLVEEGYAEKRDYTTRYTQNGIEHIDEGATFWLTRKGLDWLGGNLGIIIYDEDR